MAIKMRVLYGSGKKKIKTIAAEIKAHYGLGVNAVDTIPPAYSCDKERIVILMISAKGPVNDSLRLFCQELTKARAQNVAIIADGKEAGVEKVRACLATGGANVIDEVLYMNIGLFAGKNLTDEESAKVKAWTEKVVASLV